MPSSKPEVAEAPREAPATRPSALSLPLGKMRGMESSSLRFATAVRALAGETRRLGLGMPGFRSPPRLQGVTRSLRRRPDGGATVAVVVRGRPWPAVVADMVEGIVTANGLTAHDAARARQRLWRVGGAGEEGR